MKKIISAIVLVLVANSSVFAITSIKIMKEDLNTKYWKLIVDSKNSYNNYVNVLNKVQEKLNNGDYRILWFLTWTSMDELSVWAQNWYKNIIQTLTDSKYTIIAKIDVLDNKFQAKLISTWDYKAQMEELNSTIDSFPQTWKKYITSFENNLSWDITTFNNSINEKLKTLSSEIGIYKNFESHLKTLNNNHKLVNKKSAEIKNIVWISKNSLDKASDEITKYANDYFSWYVEWKWQKQVQLNDDMSYFQKERNNKRELVLGFVSKKVSDVITEVTTNYYPDIDTQSLNEKLKEINELNANVVVKNADIYLDKIKIANNMAIDYIAKLTAKLDKFKNTNSKDKEKVFEIVKKDVLEWIRNISPIVDQELNDSFSSWLKKIEQKKISEKSYMENALVEYNKKMSSANLDEINTLISNINVYKKSVSLPSNIEILNKYADAAEKKVKEIKYQNLLNNINSLAKAVDNAQLSETEKIATLKDQINLLDWKTQFQDNINQIKLNLQLKENLNKLYKAWAIRYFYNYWDLSDLVKNILSKYYSKYEDWWKKQVFVNKIKWAYKKIDVLMKSLSNDKQSYYIVMIYNGLIKFDKKYNIWK